MIEFVMALPFLATVIGFTFFFGWGMLHKQQTIMASRYSVWEGVDTGIWPSEDQVNRVGFGGKAGNLVLSDQPGPDLAKQELLNRVNQDALSLADATIGQAFTGGHRGSVAADFTTTRALWQQFGTTITSSHARDGLTWGVEEVNCWNALRDVYFSDFQQSLNMMDPAASGLVATIEDLYSSYWGKP